MPDLTVENIALSTGVTLRVMHGGSGPALLLLHGHPRTHKTWLKFVRQLQPFYSIVAPDLRGYGMSSKPDTTDDHTPYSKRTMADDCVALMGKLDYKKFAVVGHDRGSLVGIRLALDHPDAISHLMMLDSIPLGESIQRADITFATSWWHWFFFAQPDTPERVINADPEAWYKVNPSKMGAENYKDFLQAIHNPATIHAMLEDYRAGLGIDWHHDQADMRNGHTIKCPVRVLWALRDDLPDLYGDVLQVWHNWAAPQATGKGIDCGHHIAEEAPVELADEIKSFIVRI